MARLYLSPFDGTAIEEKTFLRLPLTPRYDTYNRRGVRGRVILTHPSDLFSVALKPFELLTYKFETFPKYELYTICQIFRTINFC